MAEVFNLLDYSKKYNGESKAYDVVRILTKSNPILDDAVTIESNSDSGHEYAVQNGLPSVQFRRAYKGVTPSKGSQTVVTETYGVLAAVSEVDKLVAEKGGHLADIRADAAKDILEAMAQKHAEEVFYGSDKVESFIGIAARYSETSDDELKSGYNVIDNGGTDDGHLTSVYVIGWKKGKIFMFFPKGTKAGIQTIDYSAGGPIAMPDSNTGGTYPGYREYFELKTGLCVQDWRYGARLANIDTSTTVDNDRNQTLRRNLMRTLNKIHSLTDCKPIIYCNRAVSEMLQFATDAKAYVNYTPAEPNAKPVMTFMGIPVHICDAIKNTESRVVPAAD